MSQNEWIRRHMERVGPITPGEARELYGCTRLAARISDIRAMGVTIDRIMVPVQNRFGDTVHVAQYSIRRDSNVE